MKGRRGPTGSRRGILCHPPPPRGPHHSEGCQHLALPEECENKDKEEIIQSPQNVLEA